MVPLAWWCALLSGVADYGDIQNRCIQWGEKVFSQPRIVQVLPLKKMREASNFHHRYTSTKTDKMRKKIQKITDTAGTVSGRPDVPWQR